MFDRPDLALSKITTPAIDAKCSFAACFGKCRFRFNLMIKL